jgi:3alpha(or 20beta)-hydroxysteroid dehydrogenase
MIRFDGEVIVVTGGAGGQGTVESALLAELGARVAVADIDGPAAAAVAAGIGSSAVGVSLDVASAQSWRAALATVLGAFGQVDGLVNNAGIFLPGPLLSAADDQFERMIAVNQLGVYHGLRVIGGHLVAHGGGSIVNIASTAALAPAEGSALYGATKAAVVNLTKSAALELGPSGVRVNAVLPGGVDTRLMRADRKAFFATLPLGRLAQPIEIARAAVFLLSAASSYCTGESLLVDGGWSLGPTEAELTGQRFEAGPRA